MEPSRDDFIIAIRSAFLKRCTKQRFSLFALLFSSIFLIVLGKFNFTAINYLKITINEVVYRTSFVASIPEKYITYSYRAIEEHIKLYKDYNFQKEELEKLKSEKYEIKFLDAENKRLLELRRMLENGILKSIPKTFLNGHPTKRLPNNANITISDIEGEAMMLYLNEYGICTSSGSACTSLTLEPSHVILAMGLPYEVAHGTLRFTLGRKTTKKDIEKIIEVLPGIVETLRKISPVNVDMDKLEIQGEKVYAN